MDFVYIGIILFIAVLITCIIVYFRKEEDDIGSNTHIAKKNERDDFEGKKILYIGDKCGKDSIKYAEKIASSLGKKNIIIGSLVLSDSSLQTHFENAQTGSNAYDYTKYEGGEEQEKFSLSLKDALEDEEWDMVILQQQPAFCGVWNSYEPYLSFLKNFIKKVRPNALLSFNMIWAYSKSSENSQIETYAYSQEKMYERICSVVSTRIDTDYDFYCVIPSATAIENALAITNEDLYLDDKRLNEKGSFLVSLCFVREVLSLSLSSLAYAPDCVDRALADDFILAVNSAYENPFFVSIKN